MAPNWLYYQKRWKPLSVWYPRFYYRQGRQCGPCVRYWFPLRDQMERRRWSLRHHLRDWLDPRIPTGGKRPKEM